MQQAICVPASAPIYNCILQRQPACICSCYDAKQHTRLKGVGLSLTGWTLAYRRAGQQVSQSHRPVSANHFRRAKPVGYHFKIDLFIFMCMSLTCMYVSLHSHSCPGTHYIDHVGFELTDISLHLPPKCWG